MDLVVAAGATTAIFFMQGLLDLALAAAEAAAALEGFDALILAKDDLVVVNWEELLDLLPMVRSVLERTTAS